MTPLFQKLRELEAKATPEPWTWRIPGYIANKYIDDGFVVDQDGGLDDTNAAFITEARNTIPKLLQVIDLYEEALRQYENDLVPDNSDYHDASDIAYVYVALEKAREIENG